MRGIVRKWMDARGYGFIQGQGRDYFVHHTGILAPGHRSLEERQVVEFEVVDGPKGPIAVDVVAVDEETQA